MVRLAALVMLNDGIALDVVERFLDPAPAGVLCQNALLVGRGVPVVALQNAQKTNGYEVVPNLGDVTAGSQFVSRPDPVILAGAYSWWLALNRSSCASSSGGSGLSRLSWSPLSR